MDEVKKPIGRPSSYDEKYCEEIIEFMGKGFSIEAFAGKIDVHKDTIYEWIKVHPDFSDAVQRAKLKCQLFWETLGIQGTAGVTPGRFNDRSWKFNMQNRFKWVDRTDVTTDGQKIEAPIVYIPEEKK